MNYEWGWVHDTDSEWLVYGDIKLYCKVHVLVLYITLSLRESPTSHLCLSSPETSAAECWGRPSWWLSQESPVIMLECSMYFSFGQARCPCEQNTSRCCDCQTTHVSLPYSLKSLVSWCRLYFVFLTTCILPGRNWVLNQRGFGWWVVWTWSEVTWHCWTKSWRVGVGCIAVSRTLTLGMAGPLLSNLPTHFGCRHGPFFFPPYQK